MLEDLRELLDRELFVPFRIILTSGDRYDVTSPLQVMLGESRLLYFFPRSDREAKLRLNQIAALETLGDTSSSAD